ncbi:hypothetical protein P691DRAFT_822385 [Macrolepiota fuliginosa MF-IS2]|uniref:Uncharacterized protein n=1 Tax=Macrolepiota fuliginosa MF-IS2 TaxID=1400762 RepID=A0A9P5WZS5_9AGAR|nr:hypothetical protein P691DRAFT_822385 [Macrolepiota fuliginosa MF-IS2]
MEQDGVDLAEHRKLVNRIFPEIEHQFLQHFGHVDFRKAQQIKAMVLAKNSGFMVSAHWNCPGYFKTIHRTKLFHTLQDKFRIQFDVAKFRAGHRASLSQFDLLVKSLILKKSQGNIISRLYHMGHGSKSLFWYWKINLKEEYY